MICNYENCNCRPDRDSMCSRCENGLAILVGIIGGLVFTAITVLLFINGFLESTGLSGWVALVTAIVYLLILVGAASVSEKGKKCICCSLGSVIFGIFGTIFSGYLSVATAIAVGEVFSAIIVGLTAFFFAYMVISVLFLIRCLARCND